MTVTLIWMIGIKKMFRAIWWMFVGAMLLYIYQNPSSLENIIHVINDLKD